MSEITVESTYVETDSEWKRGCGLSEYKGVFSISGANEDKEDKKWLTWCYPKTKDGAGEKMIPNQVKLGDIDQAKKILRHYLNLLASGDDAGGDVTGGNDVPF